MEEDREKGHIPLSAYLRLLRAMGGFIMNIGLFLIALFNGSLNSLLTYQILDYTNQLTLETRTKGLLNVFIAYFSLAFSSMVRADTAGYSNLLASRRIHSKMSFGLLHCKINEFYNRISHGVIMNRFSEDLEALDTLPGVTVSTLYIYISFVLVNWVIIIFASGSIWLVIPCIIVLGSLIMLRSPYMSLKRELLRLKKSTKSPITGCISETISGIVEIRTLQKKQFIINRLSEFVNENTKNNLLIFALDAWFNVVSLTLPIVMITIPSFILILYKIQNDSAEKDLKIVILFFLNITALSSTLLFLIRHIGNLESSMISVERCFQFEDIEPEIGYKNLKSKQDRLLSLTQSKFKKEISLESSSNMFNRGEIELLNISAKYPTSTNPVLDQVSLSIKPGEKIGIVGRTGAGKTSFIKIFWRGLDIFKGTITIDGVNIYDIDVKDLRREIVIVSQDPAISEGSLRENLDPQHEFITDRESQEFREREASILNDLLELGFDSKKLNTKGLDFLLESGGSNLSSGERQIVSFTRALISSKKIVLLDEATSSMDLQTEASIQKMIKQRMSSKTILIVAHRIQTVLNCDKIAVFEKGKVAEFDYIEKLINKPHGKFRDIYEKFNRTR